MADEYTPPATQEELDAIVGARLKREREKYADYEDLKRRAAEGDKALEAANAEVERLKAEAAKRDEAAELDRARAKVAKETGVPAELVAGGDEAAMRSFAEAVAAFAKRPAAPKVEGAGRFDGGPKEKGGWKGHVDALFPKE